MGLNLAGVRLRLCHSCCRSAQWLSAALRQRKNPNSRLQRDLAPLPDALWLHWFPWPLGYSRHFSCKAFVFPISSLWKFPWLFATWPFFSLKVLGLCLAACLTVVPCRSSSQSPFHIPPALSSLHSLILYLCVSPPGVGAGSLAVVSWCLAWCLAHGSCPDI